MYDKDVDKLDLMFNMQRYLQQQIAAKHNRYPTATDHRISVISTAIIHEAVELQRLTSWKWWKKHEGLNLTEAKDELIDVLHFVLLAAIELGMSPIELYQTYYKKMQENIKRQENNY